MASCCGVLGCNNTRRRCPDKSFYKIPSINRGQKLAVERRNTWLVNIGREDEEEDMLIHLRVCSDHFLSGKPSKCDDPNDPDWAPSQNLQQCQVFAEAGLLEGPSQKIKRKSTQKKDTTSKNTDGTSTQAQKKKQKPSSIKEMNQLLQREIKALEEAKSAMMKDFRANIMTVSTLSEGKMRFYTGLPSSATFTWLTNLICGYLREFKFISPPDQLLLTLMRLRQDITIEDLAYRFGIAENEASKVYDDAISNLFRKLKFLMRWPDIHCVSNGQKVCVIIDCIEFPIEKPFHKAAQDSTWSNSEGQNTVKALLGVAPTGAIVFVSKCWGGAISNKELILASGFLERVKCGDVIVACRDFAVTHDVALLGGKVLTLPPTEEQKESESRLTGEQIWYSDKLSTIVQAFERIKTFRILSDTLPSSILTADMDRILRCCSALSNLQS